jgi:hypothetical protein
LFGTKFFDLWRVTQLKIMDNKSVTTAAIVIETWKLDKFTSVALDLAS